MWAQHLDWHHFRPPRSTITSKRVKLGGGHDLTLEMRPNGGRYSKTLYWDVLGSRGWGFNWSKSQPANTPNPQNLGYQNSPFKLSPNGSIWSNTSNWQMLWSHSSCKCTKIFRGFALKFVGKIIAQHIGGLSPTICGLFCFCMPRIYFCLSTKCFKSSFITRKREEI